VTTPKFPPPPEKYERPEKRYGDQHYTSNTPCEKHELRRSLREGSLQKRSGFSDSLAFKIEPSAVTTVACGGGEEVETLYPKDANDAHLDDVINDQTVFASQKSKATAKSQSNL
jgi:hypothetical protein